LSPSFVSSKAIVSKKTTVSIAKKIKKKNFTFTDRSDLFAFVRYCLFSPCGPSFLQVLHPFRLGG
jgi:hypothetical protein